MEETHTSGHTNQFSYLGIAQQSYFHCLKKNFPNAIYRERQDSFSFLNRFLKNSLVPVDLQYMNRTALIVTNDFIQFWICQVRLLVMNLFFV